MDLSHNSLIVQRRKTMDLPHKSSVVRHTKWIYLTHNLRDEMHALHGMIPQGDARRLPFSDHSLY